MEKREAIDKRYSWSIDEMFTEESFMERILKVRGDLERVKRYENKLSLEDNTLHEALTLKDEIYLDVMDLYCFAHMKLDENTKDPKAQTRYERASAIMVEMQSTISFIEPSLLQLDEVKLLECITSDSRYEDYNHVIADLLRQKAHVLSQESERLLAMLGDVVGASQDTFGMLDNADMTYGDVVLPDGTTKPLTKGSYIKFLEDSNQEVRKAAFVSFYKSYEQHKNTLTATYSSSVKKDIAFAKIRGYKSALEMYLDGDNIPSSVYDNLVASISKQSSIMHRYVALRKRMLQLDELHIYDVYAPLVGEAKREISFDEGFDMVIEGLKPLGSTYNQLLVEARDNRWIDVYETEGKRGGAYSWGTYRSKPYILLNYQNNLNDVFTLAHELGHSMHSYFSRQAQPPSKANYSLFVAEVASTVNEVIVMQHLLANTHDPQEKMFLLNHFMEQYKGTVYRQTMFAEFEREVHESYEKNEPLNVDDLSNLYYDLNKKYFGPHMILDDAIRYEWMRIPHFYNAFYVYKYATGFSAAVAISKRILDGEPGALDGYFEFLKAGGSMYPLDALKLAGVDMTRADTVDCALGVFGEVISAFEALI